MLRALSAADLDALMDAFEASFAELSHWLVPFASMPTREAEADFLAAAEDNFQNDRDHYGFLALDPEGTVVGGASLHPQGTWAGIGYWAATSRSGRGQTTDVAEALTSAAFAYLDLEAVQIHCDAANHASAAIPARLGYRLIGGHPREIVCPGHTGWGLTWEMRREQWGARRSDLEIRTAIEADLERMVAVFPTSADYFDERQAEGRDLAELVIAETDGSVVGDVCLRWDDPPEPELAAHLLGVPYLNHLEVAESSRRRGVGARLALAGESRALARGAERIYLGVEPDNPGARRLYERLGYFEWPHGLVPTGWTYKREGVVHEYRTALHILVKTLRRLDRDS